MSISERKNKRRNGAQPQNPIAINFAIFSLKECGYSDNSV